MSNYGFIPINPQNNNLPGNANNININVDNQNINENSPKLTNTEESERSKELKKEITKLVSLYPQLKLRSTFQILEKLNQCSEEQLENMLTNAQIDINAQNGTPGADALLTVIGAIVDNQIPGFHEEVHKDMKLHNDVELLIQSLIGVLGFYGSIPLRMFGCAQRATLKRKGFDLPENNSKENDASKTKKSKTNQNTPQNINTTTTNTTDTTNTS